MCVCVFRTSSYIEERRAREKGGRERWLLTMLDKREKELVFFCFSYRRTDTTWVQTSTIPCILRNSVRRGGSRERRERTGISFASLASVPIQVGCKQVQFPMCCTIPFDEVVVEKEERELVFLLLLLPAYRYNLGANK